MKCNSSRMDENNFTSRMKCRGSAACVNPWSPVSQQGNESFTLTK